MLMPNTPLSQSLGNPEPPNGGTVSVVITTFNDAQFLSDALVSVMQQSVTPHEIVVVDDGSEVSPAHILQAFPGVTLIRKTNGGLASARNAGLHKISSEYVCFLDADDRFEPTALSTGLLSLTQRPDAAFTYGGHRRIKVDGTVTGGDNYKPVGSDPLSDLLEGNLIGMHATVLYRRDVLVRVGGFNENLRRCEDYDLYLRITSYYPVLSHPDIIAEYRWHGQNMSRNTKAMLETVLLIHEKFRPDEDDRRLASWTRGERNWKIWYKTGQNTQWESQLRGFSSSKQRIFETYMKLRNRIPKVLLRWLFYVFHHAWPPPVGALNFGSLASTVPASQDFGWDRGTPIDRYYIDRFLLSHATDIRGRVLEVGDNSYSRRFGGDRITRQDVLHVDCNHPKATIIGDISNKGTLPEDTFDCIVFTQTLHLIFQLGDAVEQIFTALKPGGVLLLTVPGISQIDRHEWKDNWYWSLTVASVRKLFQPYMTEQELDVRAFGNVFAAIAFLFGAVVEEVKTAKLDEFDQAYPVVITLRAKKRDRRET